MRVCQTDALANGAGGTFENITLMLLQDNSHIQYQNQPEQKTPKRKKKNVIVSFYVNYKIMSAEISLDHAPRARTHTHTHTRKPK